MITDYHAKYYAYELTKRSSSDSLEKLAGAVASAQVDLNPHQVDAALFAFHSPLSKGAGGEYAKGSPELGQQERLRAIMTLLIRHS